MNRNMSKKAITDAKKIREYRNEHPRRLKVGDNSSKKILGSSSAAALAGVSATDARENKELILKYTPPAGKRLRGTGPVPSDFDPAFTYGKPTG
jgi:hypothetical protein